MISNNLSIEDSDLLDVSSEVLSNKETQTSSTYITDSFDLVKGPSRPLPKGINKSNVVEPPVNNILDCRVLKDPSDSKSTDLETESFVKDIINSNPSVSIDEVSESPSSLNYCKEVAQPYLKSHLSDCEDHVESLEKLIQEALEDFPDYQPCLEIYEGKQDIQEKVNKNSTSTMDTIPNKTNNENEKTPDSSTKRGSEKTDNQSIPKSVPTNVNIVKPESHSDDEVPLPKDDTSDQNKNKELNRSISMESITKCIKDSLTAIKRSASSCLDKIEIVIGLKKPENPEEKPTYYAMEKPKVDTSPSQNVQTETGNSLNSLKNLLNNPSEKIATFTEACKDFAENLINNPNERICAMKDTCKDFAENLLANPDEKMDSIKKTCKDYADKFYNTSKDAVTLLSSESAKFFSKSNTDLNSDDNSNENQTKQKQIRLRNINADSITSFLFKKAENKPVNDDPSKDKAITGPSRITDAIPPAVKLGFNKLRDDIIAARIDKSSTYDKPLPKEEVINKPPDPPETRIPTVSAIDHTPDPPSSSNVFEMIRSKIFSIFLNEGEKSPEPAIQESQNDDEEEDPFERFMEQ